jgi:hypothetical protein
VRQQASVLLHVSYTSAQLYGIIVAHISSCDSHFTAVRLDETVETAEQCRLTRAAFAYECDSSSGRNVDAYIVEREHRSEMVADVACFQGARHSIRVRAARLDRYHPSSAAHYFLAKALAVPSFFFAQEFR